MQYFSKLLGDFTLFGDAPLLLAGAAAIARAISEKLPGELAAVLFDNGGRGWRSLAGCVNAWWDWSAPATTKVHWGVALDVAWGRGCVRAMQTLRGAVDASCCISACINAGGSEVSTELKGAFLF